MEGVVILNQFEQVIGTTWGWDYFCTFCAIFTLVGLFGVWYWWHKKKKADKYSIAWAILLLVITLFGSYNATSITETRYEIYLPAEVNMSEFTEKYRIVEQRGWIYTVVENEIQAIEEG